MKSLEKIQSSPNRKSGLAPRKPGRSHKKKRRREKKSGTAPRENRGWPREKIVSSPKTISVIVVQTIVIVSLTNKGSLS